MLNINLLNLNLNNIFILYQKVTINSISNEIWNYCRQWRAFLQKDFFQKNKKRINLLEKYDFAGLQIENLATIEIASVLLYWGLDRQRNKVDQKTKRLQKRSIRSRSWPCRNSTAIILQGEHFNARSLIQEVYLLFNAIILMNYLELNITCTVSGQQRYSIRVY